MNDIVTKLNQKVNPSSIDSFKSMITARHGLARANRFMVIMKPPTQTLFSFNLGRLLFDTIVAGNDLNYRDFITDPRDIAMLCESASIPGKQIQTLEYASWRQPVKVPMAYMNEDVTMVFHLTNDYYAKKLFDDWSNLVIDPKTYHLRFDPEYKADVIIQQLDSNNIPVYARLLKNAYPVGVNSVPLDNNDTATQKLSVTFTYDDQAEMSPTESIVSGVKNVVGGFLTKLI
jgi:hypothetical protein